QMNVSRYGKEPFLRKKGSALFQFAISGMCASLPWQGSAYRESRYTFLYATPCKDETDFLSIHFQTETRNLEHSNPLDRIEILSRITPVAALDLLRSCSIKIGSAVVVCNEMKNECRAWLGVRTEVLMAHRCSINCIVPPHILLKLLESKD